MVMHRFSLFETWCFCCVFYLASFSFWPYDIVSSSLIRFVLLFVVVVSRLITSDKPIGMYTNERDSFDSVREMKMYRLKKTEMFTERNKFEAEKKKYDEM